MNTSIKSESKSKSNNRRQFFANKLHRQLFFMAFFASFTPIIITTICLYYLIFNITADQIGIPETIATTVFPAAQKVLVILIVTLPIVFGVVLVCAFKITHKIIGPFDRILRELDEIVKGTRKDPLSLRKGDKFWPLVEKINALIKK